MALDNIGLVMGVDWGAEEVEGNNDGTEADVGVYRLFETPDFVFESSKTPDDIVPVELWSNASRFCGSKSSFGGGDFSSPGVLNKVHNHNRRMVPTHNFTRNVGGRFGILHVSVIS